jgi:hypothetical protein
MATALIGLVIPLMLAVATDGRGVAAPAPEIFAPGVISASAHEAASAFTADGNTV